MNERAEIYVTIADERLKLVLPGDGWTYPEAKIAKEVSEGMMPTEIEERLLGGDPDAWLAVLRISYMRADKDFPTRLLAEVNILELVQEVTEAATEILKRRPPTKASANGSDALAESGQSEKTEGPSSERTTSEISGTPV